MKKFPLLLVGFFMLATVGLFAQTVEKTFVKAFNLLGAQEVTFYFNDAVDVQTWSQPIARVQMTVQLERGSDAMLRSLTQAGRYNLLGKLQEDGTFAVSTPGLAREMQVNGQTLVEGVSYVVFVPENVRVKIDNTTSAASF